MSELTRKNGKPPIPYLEVLAVLNQPLNVKSEDYNASKELNWALMSYKKKKRLFVDNYPYNGINYEKL